jgi:ribosomal protein S18 acetylase RimI-like enzyme
VSTPGRGADAEGDGGGAVYRRPVLIKRLAPGDEELLTTAAGIFRGGAEAGAAAFLADPSTLALLALEDDVVAGWAWGYRQRHLAGYTQVQLYQVDVVPGARRRGVATALVGEFLSVARAEGQAKMWLFTGEDNAAARGLYESLGGNASGTPHATYWWSLGELA